MSYLLTYVRREGQEPITVNAPGYDERTIRSMAGALAALSRRVTLSEVDSDGIPQAIGRWVNGRVNHDLPEARIPKAEPVVIDAEPADDTAETQSIAEAAAASDNEMETHSAYCMKCHEKRDVTGRVNITDNGRRQFTGPCPVCGTNVFRFLPSEKPMPIPEWSEEEPIVPEEEPAEETAEAEDGEEPGEDNPDDNPDAGLHALFRTEGRRGIRYSCECGEWESEWVKSGSGAEARALADYSAHAAEAEEPEESDVTESDEDAGAAVAEEIMEAVAEAVPEGTPIAEVAEAAAIAAVEFSHAAEDAEKPAPRKRTGRATKAAKAEAEAKATEPVKKAAPRKRAEKAEDTRTPNQRAAANPVKGKCPQCEQMVDIIERAGLQIYTYHPDPKHGKERCDLSTSVVGA